MNVLFFSVSTGEGHTKAAQALKETIEQKYPSSKTLVIDALKYTSPFFQKIMIGSYLTTLKAAPFIYDRIYKSSDSTEFISKIGKSINGFLSFKLEKVINDFNPFIIICTHSFPLQMLAALKRNKKINVPIIVIVTDFTNHLIWKEDFVDAFVVAHEYIKNEMINTGIPSNKIYTYGIPVSPSFLEHKNKKSILKDMELEDMPTCLLMGGSLGLGQIQKIFVDLLNCKRNLQIVAVAGKNTDLKRQLEKHASYYPHKKVKILGYTERIPDLMTVSDLIITKPGGMTISEALIKKLPIFIISPIPGQEEKNTNFLLNSGAAARIYPGDNIESILCQTLDNPLRKKHMAEMAQCLAYPYSSKNTLDLIERLVYNSTNSNTIIKEDIAF